MLFNSTIFIFAFFPVTLFLFYLFANVAESPWRRHFIIIASLFFYSQWNLMNLPVILVSIAANYALSRKLTRNDSMRSVDTPRQWLILGLIFNISLLVYFKYTNFFLATFSSLTALATPHLDITLPLGISFFTFQQIIYLTDLYKGRTGPANLTDYAVCVCFFPHLIAGPIIQYRNLLPQLSSPIQFKVQAPYVAAGIGYFTLGLAKKLFLADRLAPFADNVFTQALQGASLSTPEAWVGAIAYTLQLYFDFSAYSDMAIGLGLCFGIELPVNFNSPYKATSIVDFWRRWHITLSYFLRNYLYIPLGGNRCGPARHHLNLILTMLLGGLWHGAGWTFILWGLLHGLALSLTHWWRRRDLTGSKRLREIPQLAQALTLLFVVIAWTPFRAETIQATMTMWKAMAGFGSGWALPNGILSIPCIALGLALALLAPNSQEIMGRFRSRYELYSLPSLSVLRWNATPTWAVLVGLIFFASVITLSQSSKFLYFDF